MGFIGIRRISRAHVFDYWSNLTSRSVGSLKISAPSNGESKDRAASTYIRPAKVKADACSIGGNTLRVYSYTFIRTQSYVCLFACECVCCAQCLWLYVHWLDVERMSRPRSQVYTSASCLPGIMLVSVRAPRSISHGCFVWHFVCLVLLLCFLPCLGWPRLKTIRYHDLTFSQKTSPLLFFAFFGYYSIDIVFAFFVLCYIKCCKFVLILQSKLPCPLLDVL